MRLSTIVLCIALFLAPAAPAAAQQAGLKPQAVTEVPDPPMVEPRHRGHLNTILDSCRGDRGCEINKMSDYADWRTQKVVSYLTELSRGVAMIQANHHKDDPAIYPKTLEVVKHLNEVAKLNQEIEEHQLKVLWEPKPTELPPEPPK